jgi:putative ABC transport system substrate-binding protein
MNRRTAIRQMGIFILTTASLAHAQPAKKVFRIGYLSLAAKPTARDEAFVQALRDLGWINGQNIVIDYRWGAGKTEKLPALAAELIALKVDLIVAMATPAIQAAKNATTTIPIVMGPNADPVGMGFVASLAQPGGNITGVSSILPELASKRIGLLKEILPKLSRVAFLAYGPDPAHRLFVKEAQEAAQMFKIRFQPLVLASVDEIESAFAALKKERADALIIQPLFISALGQGPRVAELAIKNRLSTISDSAGFAEAGGLMSYGPDNLALMERTATLVDKVLKGRKPADLPVEQPMKFDFVINLQTAKKIGLNIPQSVLFRATKVIK